MLLFVRNPYWRDIVDGKKAFELRAGTRYRNLRVGDVLSLNGKLRVTIRRIEACANAAEAAQATRRAHYALSPRAIAECYPNEPGPFWLFHFDGQKRKGNTTADAAA